jgi:hypothetical protein
MNTNSTTSGINPVLWLVIGLPCLAVVASFASLYLALRAGDVPLPDRYHWEGAALDAEQAHLRSARKLGLSAQLRIDSATRRCEVLLHGAAPSVLRLDLADGSKPANDRHLRLQRAGDFYSAPCETLPVAHWWVELADDAAGWALRDRQRGNFSTPLILAGGRPAHAS